MDINQFAQQATAHQINIGGINVNYYEAGKGTPLILLHGWPQTSYIWRKVIPALQKQYRVLAIDLPGMGNTDSLPSSDTLAVARLIKTFCDRLQLSQVHLIGHDIGGWVAVTFALEYQQTLKSLMVLDAGIPGLIPNEVFSPLNAKKIWQFYFHAIDQIPEFLLAGKEKEYLNWYFSTKTSVKGTFTAEDIELYVKAYSGEERLRKGFDYYRAFAASATQNKSYRQKLQLPILAIGGADAQAANVGVALQKISSTEIIALTIEDCGHYIVEEQPELFIKHALSFLDRITT